MGRALPSDSCPFGSVMPFLVHERRSWLAIGFAALAIAMALPRSAFAQDATFSLDRLRIGGAPEDGVGVWRPDMGDDKKARLYGQLDFGFQVDPFRIEQHIQELDQAKRMATVSGAPVVGMTNMYADIGAELFGRFAIQVMMPVSLEIGPVNPTESTSVPASQQTNVSPQKAAAGDLRVDLRGILFKTKDHFFKLGLQA